MPLVEVTVTAGRPPERLRQMITEVTDAVHTSLDVPVEKVRVVIREVPTTHWAAGGVTIAERDGEGVSSSPIVPGQ